MKTKAVRQTAKTIYGLMSLNCANKGRWRRLAQVVSDKKACHHTKLQFRGKITKSPR